MAIKYSALPAMVLANVDATNTITSISDLSEAVPANRSKKMTMGVLAQWIAATGLSALVLTMASGYIKLGASPGSTAAVNVDAASYAGFVFFADNGAHHAYAKMSTAALEFGTTSADPVRFFTQGGDKIQVVAEAAGTASLQFDQATARIVGGSTNGLAIRNSGNTVDNLQMTDAGNLIIKAASGTLIQTATALTNNAAAQAATLTNGPTAGNPTKWIPINDNGVTRNIPAW